MTHDSTLMKQEQARSTVYLILAGLFRQPGSYEPGTIEALKTCLDRLTSRACEKTTKLVELLATTRDSVALEVDFSKLFIGPFLSLAPPYGSIYLDGERRMMGDSTINAQQQYREAGFDISPEFKDAPDHICVELEFMHALIRIASEAIALEDFAILMDSLNRQHFFLKRHLGAWVPQFAELMTEHASSEYFKCLADVTRQFIAEELETLDALTSGQAATETQPNPATEWT